MIIRAHDEKGSRPGPWNVEVEVEVPVDLQMRIEKQIIEVMILTEDEWVEYSGHRFDYWRFDKAGKVRWNHITYGAVADMVTATDWKEILELAKQQYPNLTFPEYYFKQSIYSHFDLHRRKNENWRLRKLCAKIIRSVDLSTVTTDEEMDKRLQLEIDKRLGMWG
jgi:hypothetical protein